MNYKTVTGSRPDLVGEVNPVIGYIGHRLYPTLNTAEKTGTVYYKTLEADSAAETGRSTGVAPSRTLITDSSTTYSCAEAIKRYGMVRDEVKQAGGIEAADKQGGDASQRSVQRAIEAAQITAMFATGAATDIGSAIISGIETGAESVRRYGGKLAFVCSDDTYKWIVKQTEITGKLSYTFNVGGLEAADTLSVKSKLFMAMLQNIIGFDEVLIFDADQSTAGIADGAGIVKLPDAAQFSHKMDPVLGKTALYMPDGEQQFEIESFFDEDTKTNTYDCSSWYNVKTLNTGAAYIVDGLGASS